jgi:hypothetical protein
VFGDSLKLQTDPYFRDLILFHEYFDGDTGRGLGASHQTGWTALVANLIEELASKSQKSEAADLAQQEVVADRPQPARLAPLRPMP